MRPGPKKLALAGPWPVINNHTDSRAKRVQAHRSLIPSSLLSNQLTVQIVLPDKSRLASVQQMLRRTTTILQGQQRRPMKQ